MIYIWGIDLAETLNYCAIVIAEVDNRIRYANLRKFNNVMYPSIQALCTGELARKYPPTKIGVDYSNNQSFSEYLEGKLNPSFLVEGSRYYGKWKIVKPVKFSQQSKLHMKHNSRQLHEAGIISYPDPKMCSPEQGALVQELIEQSLREAGEDGPKGLKFAKPEGFDNDLAMANELMLDAAAPYVKGFVTSSPPILGVGLSPDAIYDQDTPEQKMERKVKKRLENNGIFDSEINVEKQ